ncbi:maleylpyruvate isomerase family mycothiol-dependent enzyme [Nocardia sp. NBC_01503]|uniref:maleylpyruvate isomerase family mycothiol-dependent enzyme n=1 Tax=Nocardia sp. NBC_01503 TaxID=2975997 RepID=UPI002E7BC9A1|nr:maleylpyruvate isomerase family mycothiol-dependent enzyme [Nocardia sp. NBC_01503]WTL34248.1 maleylpyruvate isomerase family mycothiol-dependent enzyme [Nocardia sp. NBC_01503]
MDYLALLCAKLTEFGELITPETDLAAPVPSCGDWTFYDLTDHLGQGNMWVVTAVAELRGDYQGAPAPKDAVALREWYDETADAIVAALSADPEQEAWTFTRSMPRTVGFWRRRRALETLMHLWDGQHALGEAEAFATDLAVDGINEVFELFAPRMIDRGLAAAPEAALRVRATDIAESWIYGPGEPVAEIAGTASDLLLALWQRLPANDPALAWGGDRVAGEKVLAGPLVS